MVVCGLGKGDLCGLSYIFVRAKKKSLRRRRFRSFCWLSVLLWKTVLIFLDSCFQYLPWFCNSRGLPKLLLLPCLNILLVSWESNWQSLAWTFTCTVILTCCHQISLSVPSSHSTGLTFPLSCFVLCQIYVFCHYWTITLFMPWNKH